MTILQKFLPGTSRGRKQGPGVEQGTLMRRITKRPLVSGFEEMDEIDQALAQLQVAEQLALDPTPESVREMRILLDEAVRFVEQFSRQTVASETLSDEQRHKIRRYAELCLRLRRLLEGALKVQWIRMHAIASITQTYTRGAKTRNWHPVSRTLNLEM